MFSVNSLTLQLPGLGFLNFGKKFKHVGNRPGQATIFVFCWFEITHQKFLDKKKKKKNIKRTQKKKKKKKKKFQKKKKKKEFIQSTHKNQREKFLLAKSYVFIAEILENIEKHKNEKKLLRI